MSYILIVYISNKQNKDLHAVCAVYRITCIIYTTVQRILTIYFNTGPYLPLQARNNIKINQRNLEL